MRYLITMVLVLVGCSRGGSGDRPKPPPEASTIATEVGVMVSPETSEALLDSIVAVKRLRHTRVPVWHDWWYNGPQPFVLDTLYERSVARGLSILLVSAEFRTICTYDLSHDCLTTIASWHAGLVRRYPNIEGIEALNEVTAWPPFDESTNEYEEAKKASQLICAIRDSVKAVDSSKLVMLGQGGVSEAYLSGLADGGGLQCMDKLVIHGYGQRGAPPAPYINGLVAQARLFTDKDLWVTEFGEYDATDETHLNAWRNGLTETRGAERMYGFALTGRYGLFHDDGSPRPTYGWLKEALR